jgi:hypothetical protein
MNVVSYRGGSLPWYPLGFGRLGTRQVGEQIWNVVEWTLCVRRVDWVVKEWRTVRARDRAGVLVNGGG